MASRRLAGCVFFATAVLSATHALAIRTRLDLRFDTGSVAWWLDGGLLTNAVVSVNDLRAARQGPRFYALVPVDNAAGAVQTGVTVYAVQAQPTNDLVAAASGTVYAARSTEAVAHAARGVIAQDSRFDYAFDWLGRLTGAISRAAAPPFRVACDYYPDGRRARKRVYEGSGQSWTLKETRLLYYDRWNLVEEHVIGATSTVKRTYLWGLDLAGQRNGQLGQDAGGIGGLAAIREVSGSATNTYLPVCDHNGNVVLLIDAATRQTAAAYEYSPYGVLLGEWGAARHACPFRFQTKYYDHETQLYYFGHRYYDPASTKWLTRDPLGEAGGINLTAFCRNDPVNNTDPLGLEPVLTERGYVDSYDLHYLGWERAVLGRETVPRFDPTIPLGDRPYDVLRGESVRMQFGEGMANAVSALPETAFMVGQGGKIVAGAAISAGDPSGLVKAFGAGLVLDGLDELKGYACGTDPYFVQGLKGLGLDERDIARVQFVKGAGQTVVLLAYALPSAHRPLSMGSPQLTASSPEFLEYMAIRQQGYTASQAMELMKQFRAGTNPGNAWAFHFTDVKHGVGIIEDVQLNAGYGIRGSGVYAGDTPTPSFALKHTPYAGWGLGRTPVRIPIEIRPNMSILRTRLPPRTIIITTDVPFEGN